MKIIICDDDLEFVNLLDTKIKLFCREHDIKFDVEKYTSAQQMIHEISDEYHLIFLDIDMPNVTGFKAVKQLQEASKNFDVIFIANRNELVYQSFEYSPLYFVRKLYLDEELHKAFEIILKKYSYQNKVLVVNEDNESRAIPISEIIMIDNDKNYLKIITADKTYRIRQSMSQMSRELELWGFIRVHNGYLVNFKYINSISNDFVQLTINKRVPLSKSKSQEVIKKWHRLVGRL